MATDEFRTIRLAYLGKFTVDPVRLKNVKKREAEGYYAPGRRKPHPSTRKKDS